MKVSQLSDTYSLFTTDMVNLFEMKSYLLILVVRLQFYFKH